MLSSAGHCSDGEKGFYVALAAGLDQYLVGVGGSPQAQVAAGGDEPHGLDLLVFAALPRFRGAGLGPATC